MLLATITCPHCGVHMKPKNPVPAGKSVKCPKCATPFTTAPEEKAKPDPVESRMTPKPPAPAKANSAPATAITCPNCEVTLRPKSPIPAGKAIKCPKCAKPFIPFPEEEPEEEPESDAVGLKELEEEVDEEEVSDVVEDEEEPPEDEADEAEQPAPKPKRRKLARSRSSEDDEDEPPEEDRPRKKRLRPKKKAGKGNRGLFIGLVGAGAIVLVLGCAGVVTFLIFFWPMSNYAKHEAAARKGIKLLNEFAAVLESVTDPESAKKAAPEIIHLTDKMDALSKEIEPLERLTPEEENRLKEAVGKDMNKSIERLMAAGPKAGMAARGEPTFTQALQRMGQAGQKLQRGSR